VTSHFLAEIDVRAPGLVSGLWLHGSLCWGEFFANSDVDFVAGLTRTPLRADLIALKASHVRTRAVHPQLTFNGFHLPTQDLSRNPRSIVSQPVFYDGKFRDWGNEDIHIVTWHELDERGITVRGTLPTVYTNAAELHDYSRENLNSYWRSVLQRMQRAGSARTGAHVEHTVWTVLGVARLHHLLATGQMTSKSGAGRYVIESLDNRWSLIAQEALRGRESPQDPSLYSDVAHRGEDATDFLSWVIEDVAADS
jgi:Domain of unknown function (DUF4111)